LNKKNEEIYVDDEELLWDKTHFISQCVTFTLLLIYTHFVPVDFDTTQNYMWH